MPRSILSGANTLLTSTKQPLSRTHAEELLLPELDVLLVADRDDQAVEVLVLLELVQLDAVFVLRFLRVAAASWISGSMPNWRSSVTMSGTLLLRRSLHVLLEREAEDADARALHRDVAR